MSDYKTIRKGASAIYKVSGSKHLAFSFEVETEVAAKAEVEKIRIEHAKANHVCYAYRLGSDFSTYKFSDDGEPSGTAGRPIYGQIQSYGLTNVLVVVVRYFGGVKLGTGGLIDAYKTAASLVLESSESVMKKEQTLFRIDFNFYDKPEVMKLLKQFEFKKLNSQIDECGAESIFFSIEKEKKEAFERKLPQNIKLKRIDEKENSDAE